MIAPGADAALDAGALDAASADAGPPQLTCAELEGPMDFCDDFAAGAMDAWEAEAGTWSVVDARLLGEGPETLDGLDCGASRMSAALRTGSEASDLAMHVELTAHRRSDQVIVLRASDASNRIELNFRADPYGDLVVQEIVDCEVVFHVPSAMVEVPHAMEQPIAVDVSLVGEHLIVIVDGETVLERDIPFANTTGRQGVAVIDRARTSFDSVYMLRL